MNNEEAVITLEQKPVGAGLFGIGEHTLEPVPETPSERDSDPLEAVIVDCEGSSDCD